MLSGLESRVRAAWPWILAVMVAAAIAIFVFEPDWNRLQTADDAAGFTELIDQPGRVAAAGAADIVFAACYGALGVVGLRVHGRGRRATGIAAGLLAVGAICDELENVLLLSNLARRATVSDTWVTLMRVPGTLKWVAMPAVLFLYWLLVRAALARRQG